MKATNHQSSTLHWKQGKFRGTVMISKHNNVAILWLAPGFREFDTYETATSFHEATDSHPFITNQMHIIEEDKTSYCKTANLWKSEPQYTLPRKVDIDLMK